MFISSSYLLMVFIPSLVISLIAQLFVKSAYGKWGKTRNSLNLSGQQVGERIRQSAGLTAIRFESVPGQLTDHYDPRTNVVRLSQDIAVKPSVASMAIVAHELGHAQQDNTGYTPLKFRAALVPMVNIGSYLGWILIIAGIFFNYLNLAWLGIAFFSGGALFALATLPVELDASARARKMLTESGLISDPAEERGVRNVLNAAALTYVAALVQAVMQILYFVSLISGRRRS